MNIIAVSAEAAQYSPVISTMNKSEFLQRVLYAKKGDRICYHVGLLMADRQTNSALNEVGKAAWLLAGMSKDPFTNRWSIAHKPEVVLVQRRLAPSFGFEYYAIKQ